MLIAMVSGKTAPGATTAAWALSLAWDAPLITADCDAGGGDMAPGMLAGRIELDRGVLTWARDTRRLPVTDAVSLLGQHCVSIPETDHLWFLPGTQNAEQAMALGQGSWERLARALELSASVLARDAIVDTGRLSAASNWPVLLAADVVVLTVRPTARSVHHARGAVELLQRELGDLQKVAVLVNGPGPYEASEVAGTLTLPLLGVLPADNAGAAALTEGAERSRRFRRTPLMRAARTIAARVRDSRVHARQPAEVGR